MTELDDVPDYKRRKLTVQEGFTLLVGGQIHVDGFASSPQDAGCELFHGSHIEWGSHNKPSPNCEA